jgi:hypothetical protein
MEENSKSSEFLAEKEEAIVDIKSKKIDKYKETKRLLEETKTIISRCQTQTDSCTVLLDNDLRAYEEAQISLNNNGLDASILLLEKLGYADFVTHRNEEERELTFSKYREAELFEVRGISSGYFMAFFFSLIMSMFMAVFLIYMATEGLGISLDISVLPSREMLENLVTYFSTFLGIYEHLYIGLGIFIFLVLFIFIFVLNFIIRLKISKNFLFAERQFKKAQAYQTIQGFCEWESSKIEEHIKEILRVLALYAVVLREQKATLERIIYVEGLKRQEFEYHKKSLEEIMDTKELIEMIQDFTSIPISEEGKLSEKSVIYLEEAKIRVNKVIRRFYG